MAWWVAVGRGSSSMQPSVNSIRMRQAKYRSLTHRSGDRYVWTGPVRCDEASLDVPLRNRFGKIALA